LGLRTCAPNGSELLHAATTDIAIANAAAHVIALRSRGSAVIRPTLTPGRH
jgi:hypothetical protein